MAPGSPWHLGACDCIIPNSTFDFTWLFPLSLLFCLTRTFVIEFKTNPVIRDDLILRSLVTSEKTLFKKMSHSQIPYGHIFWGGHDSTHYRCLVGRHLCLQISRFLWIYHIALGLQVTRNAFLATLQPIFHPLSWIWQWNATGPVKMVAFLTWL